MEWMNWPVWDTVGITFVALMLLGFGAYAVARLQRQIWRLEDRVHELERQLAPVNNSQAMMVRAGRGFDA